jgi:hypothetical protein
VRRGVDERAVVIFSDPRICREPVRKSARKRRKVQA